MDLALNNLQKLICHKTQTTNQIHTSRMQHKVNFRQSFTGLNFPRLVAIPRLIKEPNWLYNLSTAGERIVGFMPFPGALALCEMQTASSRF